MHFNETQQKIVNHINGPLLCIAGPGSGKTTSIIGRVNNLVANGIQPSKILVVTFTKAAADEMKERYLKMPGAQLGPTFGTIHSLCFRILRNFDSERYTRDCVITEQEQRSFIRNEIKYLRIERSDQEGIINAILSAISNIKNNGLDPLKVDVEGCDSLQFNEIYKHYEQYKQDECKIDYDDMLFLTDKILSSNPDILSAWRNTFSHLIIDEFQDTNILQSQILYNIAYPLNNICVVGDDDQCQPAGTKILMSNNEEKNIEEIIVGDKLMKCGNPNENNVKENIVLNIGKREYNGNMITIKADYFLKSSYTADHRTFAKLNFDKSKYAVCLRLDKKNRFNMARIPFTAEEFEKLKKENNKFWLLYITKSIEDAENELKKIIHQMIMRTGIKEILSFYGKEYDLPFYDVDIEWLATLNFERNDVIELFAQNLMVWNMSVIVNLEQEYNLSKPRYSQIEEVAIDNTMTPITVYSLHTSTGTYVADDIVTHNCIYRFRGAVPQIMLDFEKQFPNAQKVILNVNYRSEPEIVATSKRLIENNKIRFDKPLAAHKTGNAKITYESFKNRDKETAQIIKQIKQKQRKNEALDQIAILYRTNSQAAQLTQSFIKADIPFYTNEMIINIYDHWIFNDFKNFKKVADGTCTINEFLSIINRPNKYIARKNLPATYSKENILRSVMKIPETWKRDKMRETLEDWYYWTDRMATMKPYDFITTIRKNLDYDKYVKSYAESNKFDESQFVDIMNEIQDASETFETFEEWFAFTEKELQDFKEKMKEKKKENSVVLSTMHRSKGLEWDEVYIIDCNEDIIPYYRATDDEDMEEERRAFYVAVTRARKILHICSIEKRNKSPMYLSRFVEEMKAEEEEHKVDQNLKTINMEHQLKPQTWVFHKTFGNGMIIKNDGKMIQIAFTNVGMKTLDKNWCIENLQLF